MNLCKMNRLSGTGKIISQRDLLQRIISYSKQPMVLLVAADTVKMGIREKRIDLAEPDVKMDFFSMLEETLQALQTQQIEKLFSQYRKMKMKHIVELDSAVKVKMEEQEATLRLPMMDIQECIDAIEDELDVELIKRSFLKFSESLMQRVRSIHGRNAKNGLVGSTEHLEKAQNFRKISNHTKFVQRLTEPNQALQYIRLRLRATPQDRMVGSVA